MCGLLRPIPAENRRPTLTAKNRGSLIEACSAPRKPDRKVSETPRIGRKMSPGALKRNSADYRLQREWPLRAMTRPTLPYGRA
jgi:hypothetical protein